MARQSPAPGETPHGAPLPTILLTRPESRGDRFAEQVRARFGRGVTVLASPLIAPRFLSPPLPAVVRGAIFTSETGVEGFARLWRGGPLPAWCVGDRTAAAAREAGFDARSARGDAEALAEMLAAENPPGPLVHARGRDARGDLAGALSARGLTVVETVVYAQIEQPLTDAARALLQAAAPVAVPLFSPRTARLFVRQVSASPGRAPLWIAALSPAVAEPAAALRPARLALAPTPDAEGMIEALSHLWRGAAQP
jgi:uroporphyrinogen-III synthase